MIIKVRIDLNKTKAHAFESGTIVLVTNLENFTMINISNDMVDIKFNINTYYLDKRYSYDKIFFVKI